MLLPCTPPCYRRFPPLCSWWGLPEEQCFEPKVGIRETYSQSFLKCVPVILCPNRELYSLMVNGAEHLWASAAGPQVCSSACIQVSPAGSRVLLYVLPVLLRASTLQAVRRRPEHQGVSVT